MIDICVIDKLAVGFVVLGTGIVMLMLDMHHDPRRRVDGFIRSLVIMCVAIGILVISNEIILHTFLFDEQPAPSLF